MWGEHIFYTEDPDFRWYGDFKGEALDPSVFVYSYEIEFEVNGERQSIFASGDVTIVK